MKITFVGHASILVEAGGVTVLSDPWWRGPCFGAQWWTFPLPYSQALDTVKLDYIYISHGHHDHLHAGTLRTLDKRAKVLVSNRLDLAKSIRELGFEVIEVADDEARALGGGLSCRIMETHAGDTLMTLSDGHEVCLNINDALHSAGDAVQRDFVARLRALHPRIDYAFCGYGIASHFPNCYVIPGKDREATAARRQQYFNRQWVHLIEQLQPRFGFPFAADVVFLERDLFWANEVVHNAERPTAVFESMYPGLPVVVKDIAPGFVIDAGVVVSDVLRKPVRAAELSTVCAEQIDRANRYGSVDDEGVAQVAELLEGQLRACGDYLRSFEGDYRFLIRLRNSDRGIVVQKRGDALSVAARQPAPDERFEVIYTTRLAYLRWALTQPFGDEILFVGSGGIFEFPDQATARTNIHRELVDLIRKRQGPTRQRRGAVSQLKLSAKQIVKRMLRRSPDVDLYDVVDWTVFDRASPASEAETTDMRQ